MRFQLAVADRVVAIDQADRPRKQGLGALGGDARGGNGADAEQPVIGMQPGRRHSLDAGRAPQFAGDDFAEGAAHPGNGRVRAQVFESQNRDAPGPGGGGFIRARDQGKNNQRQGASRAEAAEETTRQGRPGGPRYLTIHAAPA